jgi:hypothetical protein
VLRVEAVQMLSGAISNANTPSLIGTTPLLANCAVLVEHHRFTCVAAARGPVSSKLSDCEVVVLTSTSHFPGFPHVPCKVSTMSVNVDGG